ncbi:SDR family NAD(P)-dependent oxidoreductase [Nocardioides nitrophenolicus]|uniref:SDR family NAD(P)-dependent oxidoreductase n=1 Tax=Nocardioides nitrophenolicus TaxID=60489 RepID=UPI00195EEA0B|nr:SDR family NAD(P)-dependent oxidoreductase [Nocardioides nitrophenolicus]MBM7516477.1 NAD(P)-dependent dehydrogenase (short-subunit alcohol dehydrogenase family) [Nocardioides nitrophenolicus]
MTAPAQELDPRPSAAGPDARGVVVTGGARGLGKGIVEVLAAAGHAVVAVDLSPDVEGLVTGLGDGHGSVVGDVCDPAVIDRACRLAAEAGDGLRAAVFNAGVISPGPTEGYPLDEWDRVIGVNLRGTFIGAQAARPYLGEGGSMVMLSSICASQGFGARASYCASKSGVDGLVRSLSTEWAPQGVRVNGIAPGTIETEMQQSMIASGRVSVAGYLERIPMNKVGAPSDIGNAAAFLISPQARYISGVVLPVDGGWAAAGLPAQV